jgi:hypothetical protein
MRVPREDGDGTNSLCTRYTASVGDVPEAQLQTPMYVYYFLLFEYRLYYYIIKQINRELRGYLERAKEMYI